MRRSLSRTAVIGFLLSLFLSSGSAAQTNSGDIQGTVRDPSGSVLPGAAVTTLHEDSGRAFERVADQAGRFFVPSLPVGRYSVTAALQGFKAVTLPNVILQVGQQLDVSITLQIGEQTETVIVTSGAPLLDTASAEVSAVIDTRRVQQLPINGRQFLQLAQLTDGVVLPPGGTRGAALEQAGSLPAVLGQRSGHNIYLLDGVKVTDE